MPTTTTTRRTVLAAVAVVAVIAGAVWFAASRSSPDDTGGSGGVAVMPSDGGSDSGADQTTGSGAVSDGGGVDDSPQESAPASDMTDPEQAARAFMRAYPGDVADLVDPTFDASLDGVDADLAGQIDDMSLAEAGSSDSQGTETYAYTISGTYQGEELPIYSIVVSRPSEPAEGGSAADNDLPYRVDSFDWSPDMLGSEDDPGPAAGLVSPITDQQRGDLLATVRDEVIVPVLTYDADETEQERQERLAELMVDPTDVEPISSRSGRYEMTIETTAWYYTTERGGPITIGYDGTWVDPYNNSRHGPWSLTATITRDDNGEFTVQTVEETDLDAPEQAEG